MKPNRILMATLMAIASTAAFASGSSKPKKSDCPGCCPACCGKVCATAPAQKDPAPMPKK